MKIAVFTPKIYRTAFEEAIRVLNRQDCFFCLEYSDFYQISELYEQLRDSLDESSFRETPRKTISTAGIRRCVFRSAA